MAPIKVPHTPQISMSHSAEPRVTFSQTLALSLPLGIYDPFSMSLQILPIFKAQGKPTSSREPCLPSLFALL